MRRRHLLKLIAASPAFLSLSSWSRATASWAEQFREALAEKPALLGFCSTTQEQYHATAQLSGKWPAELRGTLYRTGPAGHEIGSFRNHHWFDGHGMVQAYRIGDGGVAHQARLIQTRKLAAEKAAGRTLYPGLGTIPPNAEAVTSPDLINVGNISMLHHDNKLFALWEAGSPWEIDPSTLQTKGLYQFSADTAGVPFSAHPRLDPDGNLWNFGYVSQAGLLVIWHIKADGTIAKTDTIECEPMSMPHDFIVTARHIVIMIPPLHYAADSTAETFLDRHNWNPKAATRVLVINKDDFDDHQWLELPAQWVFHYGNGWEDNAGVIRFDAARAPDPLTLTTIYRDVMRGVTPSGPRSHHYMYRLDTLACSITETPLLDTNIASDFPVIDPRVSCQRNRQLVFLSADTQHLGPSGLLNAVSLFNVERDVLQTYRYPDTQIPEEHLYVPRPGSRIESQGWIVGTALNYATERTLLNVFDAQAVTAGPIATATLPYALPLGLHGKFV